MRARRRFLSLAIGRIRIQFASVMAPKQQHKVDVMFQKGAAAKDAKQPKKRGSKKDGDVEEADLVNDEPIIETSVAACVNEQVQLDFLPPVTSPLADTLLMSVSADTQSDVVVQTALALGGHGEASTEMTSNVSSGSGGPDAHLAIALIPETDKGTCYKIVACLCKLDSILLS